MKFFLALIAVVIVSAACGQSFKITPQLSEIPSSIRGLSVVDDRVVWFSGSKGHVGRSLNGGVSWRYNPIKDFETLDFRSLYAFDSLNAIIANTGSPAYILKTSDGGKNWHTVYSNSHPDIFLDGIDFWDTKSGLVYGDPIDGRMLILKTVDGGNTWIEIEPGQRPALSEGEASFAASGTGIRCFNKKDAVIATGGSVSRLWISPDGGQHWTPKSAPIIQGKNTTGIFSVAIRKDRWIVVGGDFQADSLKQQHIYISSDAGRNWAFPSQPTGGYRSCVEFFKDKSWIAVGQGCIDYSIDNGSSWTSVPNERGFHVVKRARKGSKIYIAGNGKVSVLELPFGNQYSAFIAR
jgi:photosystem II stability/assembly factor-like uncharacterized protein